MFSSWLKFFTKEELQLSSGAQRMYELEKLDNFRWVSTIFGTSGKHVLTDKDLIAREICRKIEDVG